jgi:hypothetical protein
MPSPAPITTVGTTFGGHLIAVEVHGACAARTRAAAYFYIIDKIFAIGHGINNSKMKR